MTKKILVTGVSGTGKTTVCRELQKRGVKTIGIDEVDGLSYWVNKETKKRLVKKADFSKEFLSTYEWICDMTVLKSLTDDIDEPIVICGNVENIIECIDFCDTSLLLVCTPETFFSRIDSRNDNEYGQSEDAKNFMLSYYEGDNKKCIEAGAAVIDAEQSIGAVLDSVMEYVK